MFCPQCGTDNPHNSQFCWKCGTALRSAPVGGAGTAFGAPAQPYAGQAQTSGKAIGSLICGILFFLFPAAIVAIILGHLSLSDIRKAAGRLTGRGMAITGLVLGYCGIVFPFVLIVAAIAIPNLLRARMAANESTAAGCLRTIVTANTAFSSSYGNGYAPDLSALGGNGGSVDCNHAHLLDDALASGLKSGYRFTYTPKPDGGRSAVSPEAAAKGCTVPGSSGFAVVAEPISAATGRSSFFIDETGVLRVERGGAPSSNSPPVE